MLRESDYEEDEQEDKEKAEAVASKDEANSGPTGDADNAREKPPDGYDWGGTFGVTGEEVMAVKVAVACSQPDIACSSKHCGQAGRYHYRIRCYLCTLRNSHQLRCVNVSP